MQVRGLRAVNPFAPTPVAFCLRFVTLVLLLTLLTLTAPFREYLEAPLIRSSAWLSHVILNLFGTGTTLSGDVVSSPAFPPMRVVSGCTGLFVFLLLLSAIVAFPAGWKSRAKGIAAGAGLLFCLNQVRLVTLFLAQGWFPHLFQDLHVFVWQGIIIVVVAFYWYAWAARCPSRVIARKA
jgi:exosortase/archaeosortase family protein